MKRPELKDYQLTQNDIYSLRRFEDITIRKTQIQRYLRSEQFFSLIMYAVVGFIPFFTFTYLKGGSLLVSFSAGSIVTALIAYFSRSRGQQRDNARSYGSIAVFIVPFIIVYLFLFYLTHSFAVSLFGGLIYFCILSALKIIKVLWILLWNHEPSGYREKKKSLQMYEDKEKEYNGLIEEKRLCDEAKVLIEKQEARKLAAKAADAAETDKKNARKNIEFWQELDGHTFEHEFAALLKDSGYTKISLTATTGDEGIDLWGTDPDGNTCIFQCKAYKDPVVPAQVRELLGSLASVKSKAKYAVMVALSGTTAGALSFAKKNELLIWNGKTLTEMAKSAVFSTRA
jgi:HJR/Mrr/RecB family endonuclease